MLRLHSVIVAFIILLYNEDGFGKKIEIECTANCVCDVYEGLRRATCHHGKMLNVKDNVPNKTELLEFSFNYVGILRNDEFYENDLSTLKLANLSHNKIGDIGIYAFNHMAQLKTLDLSHNALQYVLSEWFWSLPAIEELYLNDNNLGILRSTPLFSSSTLKVLNLAHCLIPHLSDETFVELPALQNVDLSNNYLIDISPKVLSNLSTLSVLKLKGNNIPCNKNWKQFASYCKKNAIYFDANFCKQPHKAGKSEERFQKMIVQVPIDDRNGWILEERTEEDIPNCITPNEVPAEPNIVMDLIQMNPPLALLFVFKIGLLLGLIIGCGCQIKPQKSKLRPRINRNRFSVIRTTTNDSWGNSLLLDFDGPAETTPAPMRRFVA